MAFTTTRSFFLAVFVMLAAGPPANGQEPAASSVSVEQPAQSENLKNLIKVLRDDASRQALLDELEKVASIPEATTAEPQQSPPELSIGNRIAAITRNFAQTAVYSSVIFAQQLAAAPATFANLNVAEGEVLLMTLRNLALVIIVTYGCFAGLRLVTRRVDRSFGKRAVSAGIFEKLFLIVASALLDIAIVLLAWGAGYLAALTVFGELGRMDIQQTLYLNAFTIVQLAKVVVRTIVSPSTRALRLVRITDQAARKVSRLLSWIITILGYGQLLLQPILVDSVSQASGQAVSGLIALVALVIAVAATLSNRKVVSSWLMETPDHTPRHAQMRFLASRWHWPILAYLTLLFFVVLIGPAERLFNVLMASAQAFGAIIVGFVIAEWLARAVTRGVTLPENVNQRLPLLERRVNGLVPRFLSILRLVIFALVVSAVLSAIGVFDLAALIQSRIGLAFTGAIASVFLILLLSYILWLALTSWVDYRLNPAFGSVATSRETTLLSLLRNAATIAIVVITLMFSLSQLGLDIAPLLASAGVLGLAIGFGAQKLVQDVINGVFIQLENAINVGDVITVGDTTGTVERLTIRSVSLRDIRGAYHIISFSSVDMVTNLMRDFSCYLGDIGIAYREDVEEARLAVLEAFDKIRQDEAIDAMILGEMEWFGVQELADSAVIIRVRVKTRPGMQFAIGRAMNGAIKQVFDARGIEIPFPHQTVYFGIDKNGDAPPAHVSIRDHGPPRGRRHPSTDTRASSAASDSEDLEN
ncbi:mechanosensitive ion channel [Rhizobium sp. LjRoot98]|uniref:mechanosensitive ion channel domain-containing protein n=1 Tax=Rhizobium sp. LjRoot98 TaxID=3342345 RepID=UPI003ECF302B